MVDVYGALWFIEISQYVEGDKGTRAQPASRRDNSGHQRRKATTCCFTRFGPKLRGERFATALRGRGEREAPLTLNRTLRTAANCFRRQT